MTFTTISVRGDAFRTRVMEAGSGPAMLFLHDVDGHPGESSFLDRWQRTSRVIAPEHPGFGESTGIDEIDDVLDISLYYRELLHEVAGGPADIVGHGLGAMFAAEIAAICPQVVNRLVLVAPFGLWLDDAQVPDMFVMSPSQIQRSSWHEPESEAAQATLTRASDGVNGSAAIVARAMSLSAAGKFLWPIPDRGLRRRLPLVTAPTLVVMGRSDQLVPAPYGPAFRDLIPGAQLVTIEEAGHHPMIEQPEAFDGALAEFLGR